MADEIQGHVDMPAESLTEQITVEPAPNDSPRATRLREVGLIQPIDVLAAEALPTREILRMLEQLSHRHTQLLDPSFLDEFRSSELDYCWTDNALMMAANDADGALLETWTNVLFLCALLIRRKQLDLASLSEVMLAQLGGARHYEDDKPECYPRWFTENWEYYTDECQIEAYQRRKAEGTKDDDWP